MSNSNLTKGSIQSTSTLTGVSSISGSVNTIPFLATSQSIQTITASVVSFDFQTANTQRMCVKIHYSGSSTMYVADGTGCTTSVYTYSLNNGDVLEFNFANGSNLARSAVFSGTTGSAQVTSLFL